MSTYLETKNKATKELSPTKVKPTAAPFKPYKEARSGTKIQVRVVHMIISLKVRDIFPIAFNVLVKGVVMAAKAEVIDRIDNANKAGFHLIYLGIISTKIGANKTNITKDGKTKKQIKKIDLVTKSDNSFLFPCSRENAGNVTLIT